MLLNNRPTVEWDKPVARKINKNTTKKLDKRKRHDPKKTKEVKKYYRYFKEGGLNVLVVTHTKLKGRGESKLDKFKGRISGISTGGARK